MARVKRGVTSHARHKEVLEQAGYRVSAAANAEDALALARRDSWITSATCSAS